jgi:hypothetical protein
LPAAILASSDRVEMADNALSGREYGRRGRALQSGCAFLALELTSDGAQVGPAAGQGS